MADNGSKRTPTGCGGRLGGQHGRKHIWRFKQLQDWQVFGGQCLVLLTPVATLCLHLRHHIPAPKGHACNEGGLRLLGQAPGRSTKWRRHARVSQRIFTRTRLRANATAHSQQLVTQLFEQTLKAIEVLGHEASGCDNAYVDLLKSKLNKLDKGLRIDQTDCCANGNTKTTRPTSVPTPTSLPTRA